MQEIPNDWIIYLKWNYLNTKCGFIVAWSEMAQLKKHYEEYIYQSNTHKSHAVFDWHSGAANRHFIGDLLLIEKIKFYTVNEKIIVNLCGNKQENTWYRFKSVISKQHSIEHHPLYMVNNNKITIKECYYHLFLCNSLNEHIDDWCKLHDMDLSQVTDWKHFDIKQYPLRSYLATIQIDHDSFSFSKTIRHKVYLLIHGYTSNVIYFRNELILICLAYFMNNYPSRIYDDTLCRLSDDEKKKFVQLALLVLCPNSDLKLGFALKNIIDLQTLWENTRSGMSRRFGDDSISTVYYNRTIYLSLLLSLTQVTTFYDALNSLQRTTGIIIESTVSGTNITDNVINAIYNKYSKYGSLKNMSRATFADSNAYYGSVRYGFIGWESMRSFVMKNQQKNIKIFIDIDINYNILMIILAISQQTDKYHFREGIQLIYRLLTENDKYYKLYKTFCKIDHDAQFARINTFGFLYDINHKYVFGPYREVPYSTIKWYFAGTLIEPIYLRKLLIPITDWKIGGNDSLQEILIKLRSKESISRGGSQTFSAAESSLAKFWINIETKTYCANR